MATYEELFNQLSAEIDLAYEQNQPFGICNKLSELVDLYIDFAYSLMANKQYAEASESFTSAVENTKTFQRYYQEIFEKNTFNDNPDEQKRLKDLSDEIESNQLNALAFSQYCSALFNNANRNPGLAASYFEQAEKSFKGLADKKGDFTNNILADYCRALRYFSEALENFFRTSFADAKAKCQQAKIILEKVIEKDLEPLKEQEEFKDFYDARINLFKADYQAIKSYYYISDARYQFNNRNFKNAAKQFSNVVNEFELSLRNYLNSPENESLKNLYSGEYYNYLGWKYLSEAEVYRESEDWDNAFKTYELVRKQWEDASEYYLQSAFPGVAALQEALLNASLNIDVYQAVCESEQQLKGKIADLQNEINELKDKLYNAIKPMGVTINNTQDVVTTVEQNAQFIQNIENNARQGIEEFLEILKITGLDEAIKKKIQSNGAEVLQSTEKGPKFLEKVKSFTKDVADVVKNVGDIAAPLIPAVKFLSMLI
jgi:hypothetical protein